MLFDRLEHFNHFRYDSMLLPLTHIVNDILNRSHKWSMIYHESFKQIIGMIDDSL